MLLSVLIRGRRRWGEVIHARHLPDVHARLLGQVGGNLVPRHVHPHDVDQPVPIQLPQKEGQVVPHNREALAVTARGGVELDQAVLGGVPGGHERAEGRARDGPHPGRVGRVGLRGRLGEEGVTEFAAEEVLDERVHSPASARGILGAPSRWGVGENVLRGEVVPFRRAPGSPRDHEGGQDDVVKLALLLPFRIPTPLAAAFASASAIAAPLSPLGPRAVFRGREGPLVQRRPNVDAEGVHNAGLRAGHRQEDHVFHGARPSAAQRRGAERSEGVHVPLSGQFHVQRETTLVLLRLPLAAFMDVGAVAVAVRHHGGVRNSPVQIEEKHGVIPSVGRERQRRRHLLVEPQHGGSGLDDDKLGQGQLLLLGGILVDSVFGVCAIAGSRRRGNVCSAHLDVPRSPGNIPRCVGLDAKRADGPVGLAASRIVEQTPQTRTILGSLVASASLPLGGNYFKEGHVAPVNQCLRQFVKDVVVPTRCLSALVVAVPQPALHEDCVRLAKVLPPGIGTSFANIATTNDRGSRGHRQALRFH
mmetsp:Transcript_60420/g.178967  ORF Transcript_60420/g.178967 Transcript_60420/m.178967 type:complete len:532 (-) Transcript_60420:457-2052(-)